MAAVTGCASCAYGAVSTSLLSFPLDIGTVQVTVLPTFSVNGNGSLSSFLTTSTITPSAAPVPGVVPTTTITFSDISQLTWATLGLTLSFPTTYVNYLGFAGAAATAPGTCAQTLAPTPLTFSANPPPASTVYPLDRTGGLPPGLRDFLANAGFPAQLGGQSLATCAGLSGAVPPVGSVTSVTIPISSATAITSTVQTTIPPPTTYTTTISSTTIGSVVVPASEAAVSTGILFNTATGNPVFISGSVTTSLTAPLAITIGNSTTVIGATSTPAVDITRVLSSISASVSGNVTLPSRTPSPSRAIYTGAAVVNSPAVGSSFAGLLAGLAAVLAL